MGALVEWLVAAIVTFLIPKTNSRNPDKLAAWKSTSRTERPAKKAEITTPPSHTLPAFALKARPSGINLLSNSIGKV